jgi:hypothetical protein
MHYQTTSAGDFDLKGQCSGRRPDSAFFEGMDWTLTVTTQKIKVRKES